MVFGNWCFQLEMSAICLCSALSEGSFTPNGNLHKSFLVFDFLLSERKATRDSDKEAHSPHCNHPVEPHGVGRLLQVRVGPAPMGQVPTNHHFVTPRKLIRRRHQPFVFFSWRLSNCVTPETELPFIHS